MNQTTPISGFADFSFASGDIEHPVYWVGSGPPVLVLHELPGLSPADVGFGKRLAAQGFTVYLPLLFGVPLQREVRASYKQLCVSREFANLQIGVSAPITNWLRSLARELSSRHGGGNVGAIGMCLTGAFAISLVLERPVTAPVIAQPGVPFSTGFLLTGLGRGAWMSQLNVSDRDIEDSAARARADGLQLLALRFAPDRICPAERLARLKSAFGDRLDVHTLPDRGVWRTLTSPPHATLTEEYDRAPERPDDPTRVAFARVVAFLTERLVNAAATS